ncbi:MAG TPA: sialidase family protein [Chthoniobacteraceae bacterium]|nr:sialidase family protein [Chthoniobacteraceae bacterium]
MADRWKGRGKMTARHGRLALVSQLAALLAAAPIASDAVHAAEPLFETTLVFPLTPNNKPNYRIPAIIQVPNGDVLVFAERRNDGPGDIGDHDIVLKRSRDKGKTWSGEQTIFDDEKRTCTDITVGLDRSNAKLWLFFLRDKKRFNYFTSADSGATWQGPVSAHEQVTKPEWDTLASGKDDADADPSSGGRGAAWAKGWAQRYGVGPGNAIVQLRSGAKAGRLIVPARHREDIGKGRLRSFAHTFFSDDHGAAWKLGGTIGINTSECQLVEFANGDVMVMSRNESAEDAPDNLRHLTATSHDGGETWGPPRRAEELITPRCHGPIERFTSAADGGKDRLLFSSPASPFRQKEHPYGRYNLTIRLSYDEGATWTAGKTIWPHPASYSDIAVLDDKTVGYVYERGDKGTTHYWDEVHFARFNLEWLTAGWDSFSSPK